MPRFARVCAIPLLLAAVPLSAQAEGGPWSVEGSLAVVSDYVWRGVSQSQEDPAGQFELTFSHESGFYIGTWGSTVDFTGPGDEDDGINVEVDLIVGYTHEFSDTLSLDLNAQRYFYPGAKDGYDIDFNEFTAALSFGGNYTAAITYSDDAIKLGGSSLYYSLGGEWELGDSGFTLAAGVGYYDLDDAIGEGYTDYTISLGKSVGPIDLTLWYTDTSGYNEVLADSLGASEFADGRVGLTASWGF